MTYIHFLLFIYLFFAHFNVQIHMQKYMQPVSKMQKKKHGKLQCGLTVLAAHH